MREDRESINQDKWSENKSTCYLMSSLEMAAYSSKYIPLLIGIFKVKMMANTGMANKSQDVSQRPKIPATKREQRQK